MCGPFAIAPPLISTIAQNNNKHPVYSDDRCGAATREGGKWNGYTARYLLLRLFPLLM